MLFRTGLQRSAREIEICSPQKLSSLANTTAFFGKVKGQKPEVKGLLDFDEFDGDPIGSFNHGRPHVRPRMNIFEKLDTFTFQASDRCRQIGNAERPVIDDVPASANETAARPRPD